MISKREKPRLNSVSMDGSTVASFTMSAGGPTLACGSEFEVSYQLCSKLVQELQIQDPHLNHKVASVA
jgi:hypothetical protein